MEINTELISKSSTISFKILSGLNGKDLRNKFLEMSNLVIKLEV